ncbi:MAG: esterase family protein [Opitutae bacterium]|nr:esterase family protein [Opitutae bacterium]
MDRRLAENPAEDGMTPPPPDLSIRLGRLLERMGFGGGGIRREMLGDVPAPGLLPRDVAVYLPPDFKRGQPAPLLIALDGQMMPRWQLPETLTQLAARGGAVLPVVTAVPASLQRIEEYGLAGLPDFNGRGKLAEQFQNYLVHGVLAAMRQRYGVGFVREQTGLFGASMGGLCALDTAWRHPLEFGVAGIFSGSLWWRADDSDPAAQQASRLMHQRVRQTAAKPPLRLWFQAGTADETEDRDGNGVIDAIQDTTELIDELRAKGFRPGEDVIYRETPGGRHDEQTWAGELPEFLRWALPRCA